MSADSEQPLTWIWSDTLTPEQVCEQSGLTAEESSEVVASLVRQGVVEKREWYGGQPLYACRSRQLVRQVKRAMLKAQIRGFRKSGGAL